MHRSTGRDLRGIAGTALASLTLVAALARADGSYEVFALPLQSPDIGPRTVAVDPDAAGGDASPFGWHDTDGAAGAEHTITRGNNVHAYLDTDSNNQPDPNGSPDGGAGLSFQFPLDLMQAPSTYQEASVTNAFYWTNVIHDILYNAGFDEAAGNFQENTYGRGGLGGDAIQLEIQDGVTFNNANWQVPADGSPARFQVGIFTPATPDRDGALASDLLGFLHGVAMSLRLVGGPANTSCLTADESDGLAYGWGDWLGVFLTARAGDQGPDPRPIAPYLFDEPPTGGGIRPTPYSTSFAVDPATYDDIRFQSQPQNVGWVWATMLWQMYWELVDAHGFSADLNADPSAGGNVLALHLVVDAMKRVPCQPGFVDGRDAILEADVSLTGGENCERIWAAFATRGLGYSANQGSSASVNDGTEAFDLPPASACEPVVAVEPGESAGGESGADASASAPRLVVASPFRDQAAITLTTTAAGRVRVRVFDVAGRELVTVVDDVLAAGMHEWTWTPADGMPSSASVVFVEATAEGRRHTRKLVRMP